MFTSLQFLTATLLSALTAASAFAESDWTQFRGPNGSGISETSNLPVEFSAAKNLVWKTALPPGHSSPVLAGDRIFLTAYETDKLLTIALNRASGKVLWKREAPRTRKEKLDNRNSPASPSPVSDGKRVFVSFGDYGLVAYGFDGNELWRTPLGPFNNTYGMGSSPVLVDGKLVLVCDQSIGSYIAAFNQSDGKQVWKTARPEALSGHSTPVVVRDPASGHNLIIAPASFRMDAYDAADGKIVWSVHGLASEMKSVPVVEGDTLYINGYNTPENDPGKQVAIMPFAEALKCCDANKDGKISKDEAPDQRTKTYFPFIDLNQDGMLDEAEWKMYAAVMGAENSLMAVKLGGHGDITRTHVLWKFQKSIPQLPSTVLYRGVIYMINDSGVLSTINPKDGTAFKQARLRGVSDKYYASPVAADGKVYIASNSGVVAVLKAGPDQEILASNNLDETIFATPAIADGRIYVRTVAGLYCFGEK
jgi:outer membrane protein assembly factor BamB